MPFDVHHPAWVDDDRFDIDYHVCQAQLPGPGTREQLLELLDRLLSSPLDNSRPLWEMYLISGLEHVAACCSSRPTTPRLTACPGLPTADHTG